MIYPILEEEKVSLPIIELIEDKFGNLSGIKEVWEQIPKILESQNVDFFRDDIENFLSKSTSVESWIENRPIEISENMSTYQEYNQDYNLEELENEINDKGILMPTGQYLFHGGFLNLEVGTSIILDRPFATSLSPGVSFFFSTIAGRAYDENRIQLLIILVDNIKTKSIILIDHGNSSELEILFASGLELKVDDILSTDFKFKVKNIDGSKEKDVPVEVFFCRIS